MSHIDKLLFKRRSKVRGRVIRAGVALIDGRRCVTLQWTDKEDDLTISRSMTLDEWNALVAAVQP